MDQFAVADAEFPLGGGASHSGRGGGASNGFTNTHVNGILLASKIIMFT